MFLKYSGTFVRVQISIVRFMLISRHFNDYPSPFFVRSQKVSKMKMKNVGQGIS
jgi:hypothetical protein